VKIFLFLCSLCKLLFCNLFKAFSLFVNFIPSIDILSVEEARMGEASTELLKTSDEKSSHLLLFIQPMII